jgi:hypothetical protein
VCLASDRLTARVLDGRAGPIERGKRGGKVDRANPIAAHDVKELAVGHSGLDEHRRPIRSRGLPVPGRLAPRIGGITRVTPMRFGDLQVAAGKPAD